MKGKKFGIIVATLAMFGILLSPTGVQALAGQEVAANPSSVSWGDSTVIRWNATVSSGTYFYNGTVFVNVTAPGGARHDYTSTFTLSDTVTDDWYNFSFDPGAVSGTWRIDAHVEPSDALNTTWIRDVYNTFTVETQGASMGRMIQDMTGPLVMVLFVGVMVILMLVMLDRVNTKGPKSGGKSGGKEK